MGLGGGPLASVALRVLLVRDLSICGPAGKGWGSEGSRPSQLRF